MFETLIPLTLGIDLGTSSIKVVAVGSDGTVVADGAAAFATFSTLPGMAEQHPADWLRACALAMRDVGSRLRSICGENWARHVAAVGLTGQLPTLVCLDESGPLGAAITWQDSRADEFAARNINATLRMQMYARTGMPIDGRYLAPMLQFHFLSRIGEVCTLLSAKDYLLFELTGLRVTEPSTAAGYGIYDLHERRFSQTLADFWQLPRALLPPIQEANTLAGTLNETGAGLLGLAVGIPVSTGAADSVCASFALAGLDPRVVSVSFGSSAVVIGALAEPRLDCEARYLLTPHVQDGWYGREMDLLATGTGYRWLSDLFSWSDDELDAHAAQSEPGAHGLSFAPYLGCGEQGALWNPKLRGGLFGLALRHSRADIARGFLEGIFFELKRCIDVLAQTARVDAVIVSGRLVNSPSTLQLLADILWRPVGAIVAKSPAAVGAAVQARRIVGVGLQPKRTAHAGRMIEPQDTTARRYADLYLRYLARAATCDW